MEPTTTLVPVGSKASSGPSSNELSQNIYFKQQKLFDVDVEQKALTVYGCGSIGSHTIIGLAKTGFKNITAIDYDAVESSNIPAQFFKKDSINLKTEAIATLVEELTPNKILTINEKLTSDNISQHISPESGSIHIIAFDNIESRKLIIEHLRGFNCWIIDGRIGGFNTQIYALKCDNEIDVKEYLETLKGKFTELDCGEKCLWGINSRISSQIIQLVMQIHSGKRVPFSITSHFNSYINLIKRMPSEMKK